MTPSEGATGNGSLCLPPGFRGERWAESVRSRHSRRRYDGREVPPELLEWIEQIGAELSRRGVAARLAVARELPVDIFRGIVGGYGKVTGASSALVLVAVGDPREADVGVGYLGEAVILEATALGLATCWVGGFFRPEVAAAVVRLEPGERVTAVSPVGFAVGDPGVEERLMKRFARSHRRRPSVQLVRGLPYDRWPDWARTGLELARLAPSAANRQPWRFRWEGDGVLVEADNPRDPYKIPKRLDCGIAMLHFEVGAAVGGVQGQWELLDAPRAAIFRPFSARGAPSS